MDSLDSGLFIAELKFWAACRHYDGLSLTTEE